MELLTPRDKALVRLEKAREDMEQGAQNSAKECSYLIKERDKAYGMLNEARQAQKQLEEMLGENSPLAQELAAAEQAMQSLAGGQPKNRDEVAALGKLFTGLKAKISNSREKTGVVSRMESFKLSPAEKLLTRHKYEIGRDVADDRAISLVRVKDINIGRIVAMKVVGAATESRDTAITQLIAEAQMIGRLEHPNIQPLYELSIDETGRAFYTAKLMKGSSLAKILDDLRAKKSSVITHFDLKRLLTVFHGVCDALAFAHGEGIAHAQLSAEHIHVGDFGEVLVTGWEKAKKIRQENIGTYEADVRADIAGLGDLLHHILTLTPALAGDKKAAVPHTGWKVPKGLWAMAQKIRGNRGATAYPRVTKMQTEVEDFRDELGSRGGRATAFDAIKQTVNQWR